MISYSVRLRWGTQEMERSIPVGSDEEAEETARFIVKLQQEKNNLVMPIGTHVVSGRLIKHVEMKEIDGAEFLKSVEKKVAQEVWKCYSECDYIGHKEEFVKTESGRTCPRCGADDCTFPYRMYKCKKCGHVDEQNAWFEEAELDLDPLKLKISAKPCDECVEKFEHSQIGVTTDETLDEYHETLHELGRTPADLEEVEVELPAT